jgi:Polyketide cyclase / dehydrase and lipid transport
MGQVRSEAWVPVEPALAFAVSQTTGEVRLAWDPFIRHQHLMGAERPAKGVRTFTRARLGPTMVSEYVSYRPPTSVGMTMVSVPWFFGSFGGGWRFVPEERDAVAGTRATWKYTYSTRPAWLRFAAEPVGRWLLGREIRHRIAAFARACSDPDVLAAVRGER